MTLNDVLGMMGGWCRVLPVLARVMLFLCLFSSVMADEKKPHVFVVISDTLNGVKAGEQLDKGLAVSAIEGKGVWRNHRCPCRMSPGRSATLSAFLYGKAPLITGVTGDYDWRRKPVMSVSLADQFAKSGYRCIQIGGWSLGREKPYHPGGRGYGESRMYVVDRLPMLNWNRLDEPWAGWNRGHLVNQNLSKTMDMVKSGKGPVFAVISDSLMLPLGALVDELKKYAQEQWGANQRDVIIVLMSVSSEKRSVMRGRVPDLHHYPGEVSFYHYGDGRWLKQIKKSVAHARVDWEFHYALLQLIGGGAQEEPEFRIFHQANWAVNETPDRQRHRGSLVVGKGYALVNGLELYPATKEMLPDLSKPLDIAEHQKLHGEMLMAHSEWWAKARPALYDPRPFLVGEKDGIVTKVTALDWRPSKTVRTDGKSPSSQPMVYQKDVLGVLNGLQNKKYRNDYPAHSGSWSVNIERPGRYQITASLLPLHIDDEQKKLAKLRGGRAFVRLGGNLVQLQLVKGATSVTVQTDADAGVTDLECWFTGQLAVERELGAFFVEIKRVGDKKFDLKAKEQSGE